MSYVPFTPQGNIQRLYHSVINDVVEGIRELFLDEGIDEQVLQDLKQIWEAKLEATRALDTPAANENRSQSRQLHIPAKMEPIEYQHRLPILQQMNCSGGIPISTVLGRSNTLGHPQTILIQPSAGVVLPSHTTLLQQQQLQQLQHLSSGNHNAVNINNFIKEEPRLIQNKPIHRPIAIDNNSIISKPNVVVQVDGNTIRLDNQRNQVSNLLFINQHNGNAATGQDCVNVDVIRKLNGSFVSAETAFFSLNDEAESNNRKISQVDGGGGGGGTENESSEDELVRAAAAETVPDVAVDRIKEDSDPLNSDDDVSEEDPLELFETENVIVCQFDKINRSKARWKFMLKDGIMNLSGKDYVFSKAQGEAEW